MTMGEFVIKALMVIGILYFLVGIVKPSAVWAKTRQSVVWRALFILIFASIAFVFISRSNRNFGGDKPKSPPAAQMEKPAEAPKEAEAPQPPAPLDSGGPAAPADQPAPPASSDSSGPAAPADQDQDQDQTSPAEQPQQPQQPY